MSRPKPPECEAKGGGKALRIVARETIVSSRRLRVDALTLESNGVETQRHLVVHPGAVVGLPLLDDGRVVLIRNERYAAEATLWELPAGTLEPGETDLASACLREVQEETGYRARVAEPLLGFYAAPGVSTEYMHVFVCRGLVRTEQHLDEVERITVHPTTITDALAMVKDGRIVDAKTIATLLYYAQFSEH